MSEPNVKLLLRIIDRAIKGTVPGGGAGAAQLLSDSLDAIVQRLKTLVHRLLGRAPNLPATKPGMGSRAMATL